LPPASAPPLVLQRSAIFGHQSPANRAFASAENLPLDALKNSQKIVFIQ
jgi:hypothetical protein